MRIASLDFLRFFAAFAVAGPHLIIYFSVYEDPIYLETVTSLAVEIFFVLSGFVLCPFLKKIFESTSMVGKNMLVFLVRRWMRTLPLYFLSLAFFFVLFSRKFDITAFKYMTFMQNFYWSSPDPDYFFVSWSLAVEEWFYILFPVFIFIFFFIWKMAFGLENRPAVYVFGAVSFIAVLTVLRLSSDVPVDEWGKGLRRVVMFRLDSIGFGILLYLFRDCIYRVPPPLILFTVIAAALYLFDAYHRITLGRADALEFRLLIFFATTLFSCAVLSLFLRFEHLFQKRLRGLSIWGGRISYGVYLFHIPIAAIIGKFLDVSGAAFVGLSIITISAVMTLVYYFFEKPILDARPSFQFENGKG